MRRLVLSVALLLPCLSASAQDAPQNLQVFPKDTPRSELIEIMRDFSFATGFRCEGCHYQRPGGGGFSDIDFASDENPRKNKARHMIRMTRTINEFMIPAMAGAEGVFPVTCKTCHRGLNQPRLLRQDMLLTINAAGVDSARTRYEFLKTHNIEDGVYDFGQWELNQVANDLALEGRAEEAIEVYLMSADYYPQSRSIHIYIAELQEELGNFDGAIASYEKALELGSNPEFIQGRIEALKEDR